MESVPVIIPVLMYRCVLMYRFYQGSVRWSTVVCFQIPILSPLGKENVDILFYKTISQLCRSIMISPSSGL
jgi:hypothetical protein